MNIPETVRSVKSLYKYGCRLSLLPEFRNERYNKTQVYRRCIETGALSKCDCSYTQFMRLCRDMELLKPATQTKNKKRQAFSKLFSNQMWQLDTMFGPHVTVGKRKVQTKLIAFIDDASRIIPHGEFFASEKTDDLISAMRSAFFKRGVPETLYVDNGAIYTAEVGRDNIKETENFYLIGCRLSLLPHTSA